MKAIAKGGSAPSKTGNSAFGLRAGPAPKGVKEASEYAKPGGAKTTGLRYSEEAKSK